MRSMRSFIGTLPRILCLLVFMVLLFSGAFAGETPSHIDVFTSGQGGYHTYRIPVLITTKKGTLLAFSVQRENYANFGFQNMCSYASPLSIWVQPACNRFSR